VNFKSPILLWSLLVIPAALALYVVAEQRRRRATQSFASPAMIPNVVPRPPRWRRHLPIGLYLVAGAAMLLALARPQADFTRLGDRGAVALVMDTSSSMRGTDVSPTRLEAAKRAVRAFLDTLPSRFEVGLISFAGKARLLSLPTRDRAALESALDRLELRQGTAIGEGIQRALEARRQFEGNPPPTAIVLLSDGINTVGADPGEAARAAADAGVTIHAIMLGNPGTDAGGPPPPDAAALRSISEVSGGRFLSASSGEGLETIYGDLATSLFTTTEPREITAAFAGAAALLLIVGAGASLAWFNRFP
jgi:Ca-activated chloride channel homolog